MAFKRKKFAGKVRNEQRCVLESTLRFRQEEEEKRSNVRTLRRAVMNKMEDKRYS